ncbi:MAG: hypothetical protein WC526_02405 [Patescibacteria group bacterium]
MAPGMDFAFARRCHICGGGKGRQFILRWCPSCIETYGEGRRPVFEMTETERNQELALLLSPPYEIPFAYIIRRVMELKGETMDFADVCLLEGQLESGHDRPMFVWPPNTARTKVVVEQEEIVELTGGHRQQVETLRGVPHVPILKEPPSDGEDAVPTSAGPYDITMPHGPWPRDKKPAR